MKRRSDPARRAAYDLLEAVEVDGAYANLVMPGILRRAHLAGRDAAFATELGYGALRMRDVLDGVIAHGAQRESIDRPIRLALRLGVHQVLFMRVPDHAAVDTTVTLVREVAGTGASRFANAVMHRVVERTPEEWLNLLGDAAAAATDTVGAGAHLRRLAAQHAHPLWLVRAMHDALADTSQPHADEACPVCTDLAALLAANNAAAHVTLAARPGRSEAASIAEQIGGTPGRFSPWAVRPAGGDPGAHAPVREGQVSVQDEGSQLVVLAAVSAWDQSVAAPTGVWLDLCAGPGGKAALLAGLAQQRGHRLITVEISEHRADLVRGALAGSPGAPQVVTADARLLAAQPWYRPGLADLVLLDAPCTGAGAVRRRPESRWRRTPEDLQTLTRLQADLADAALEALAPGGLLAYITCSPLLPETTAIVEDLIAHAARSGVTLTRVDALAALSAAPGVREVETLRAGQSGPDLRLWPHRHDTDGMYLALLRRA